jgi:hypothetical protein
MRDGPVRIPHIRIPRDVRTEYSMYLIYAIVSELQDAVGYPHLASHGLEADKSDRQDKFYFSDETNRDCIRRRYYLYTIKLSNRISSLDRWQVDPSIYLGNC